MPAPAITATDGTYTGAGATESLTDAGCVNQDWLLLVAGGDIGGGTACTTSTAAGPHGAWTDAVASLTGTGDCWFHTSRAQVTATGSVTAQTDPNPDPPAAWGNSMVRARGSLGKGNSASVTTGGAAQTVSLTVSKDHSAVFFISLDFSAGAVGSGWTGSGAVLVHREVIAGSYTVHVAYGPDEAAGTRSYGSTGAGGNDFVMYAVEILGTPDVGPFPHRSLRAAQRFRRYKATRRQSFEVESAISAQAATGVGRVEQRAWTQVTSAKGGAGAGVVNQRAWTDADSAKGGVGAGRVEQRAWTDVDSLKGGVGAARVEQRAWTQAARLVGGVGLVVQRALTQATGFKTGVGSSRGEQRTWTDVDSLKGGVGTGVVTQRAWTDVDSLKQAVGVAQVYQRTRTQMTSLKGGVGAGIVTQRGWTTSATRKQAAGVGLVAQRAWTTSVTIKQAIGAIGNVVQRSYVQAQSVPTGVGRVVQRALTQATGFKGATTTQVVSQRAYVQTGTGVKGGVGVGVVTQRTRTTAAGSRSTFGIAQVFARASTTSVIRKQAIAAGRVEQRNFVAPTSAKGGVGIAHVAQRSFTYAIKLLPQIGIIIRTRGRESRRTLSGRESDATISGRESDGTIVGVESDRTIAGRESTSRIAGREDGTP